MKNTSRALLLPGLLILFFSKMSGVQSADLNEITFVEPIPESMGTLGDSISAGFLSKYSLGKTSITQLGPLYLQLINFEWLQGPAKVFETPEYSWAGGTNRFDKVSSHFERLQKLSPDHKILLKNVAHSGDKAFNVLDQQVELLKAWSREELHQEAPDYVTLLIGANDVCASSVEEMTSVEDYEETIASIIDSMLRDSSSTKLLISSLPNIEQLRSAALGTRIFRDAPIVCEKFWKQIKLCPTLTTIEGPDRLLIKERVDAFNKVLEDLTSQYQKIYGDRVRRSNGIYDIPLSKDFLSIDCFHPNPKGHKLLSDSAWEDTWWGDSATVGQ